jgi:hypothetical protein
MVVAVGDTAVDPDPTGVTNPMPLSMEAEDAPDVVQERVEDWPLGMLAGEASRVQVTAAAASGGKAKRGTVEKATRRYHARSIARAEEARIVGGIRTKYSRGGRQGDDAGSVSRADVGHAVNDHFARGHD